MLLVVTYDVNTTHPEGARRLRAVAKLCERYGIRVQNSVFEVNVDAAQLVTLKAALRQAMDPERDSIRFYRLGNTWKNKIDILGAVRTVQTGEALIL